MKFTTTRIAILGAAAATGALLGLAVAPHAHADQDQDATYLMTLSVEGIHSIYGTQAMIEVGHQVCAMRLSGDSDDAVISYVYRTSSLDAFDSGYLVGAAESAYCPSMSHGETAPGGSTIA